MKKGTDVRKKKNVDEKIKDDFLPAVNNVLAETNVSYSFKPPAGSLSKKGANNINGNIEYSQAALDKNLLKQNVLLSYYNKDISMNARKGIDPTLFFDASKDFKLSIPQLEQILHISGKTIQNKLEKNIALGPVHSEHLLKLMALYKKGVQLFRTVDEFNHWLTKPFWFSKEQPLDWLVTPGGIDAIMDELVKMAYGDAI